MVVSQGTSGRLALLSQPFATPFTSTCCAAPFTVQTALNVESAVVSTGGREPPLAAVATTASGTDTGKERTLMPA